MQAGMLFRFACSPCEPIDHAMSEQLYDHPDLYDLVMTPNAAAGDFYLAEARKRHGPVLVLASGTGRISNHLANAGIEVVGLDQSMSMIARARERAQETKDQVEFIRADMRRFDLGSRKFSLVILPSNSMLHLLSDDDVQNCLACVRQHLADDGAFTLDIFVPSQRILQRNPDQRFEIGRYTHPTLGSLQLEESTAYDPLSRINHSTWIWSTPEKPDFLSMPLKLRQIEPAELQQILEAGGFHLSERYGTFDRKPFGNNSMRQICVAEPAA